MERYLTRPRHIELQVFADTHGNVVCLGERDCSTQRRHQKLIEESPAPELSDEIRAAMNEAAVKVTRGCGYVNAGTVECLYQDGEFWFLEMNTRLQVEHCVTEEVTQLDLVAEQLRVAAGEPLSFTADDVVHTGHSIECRINAENPADELPALPRHHLAPAAARRSRRALGRRLRAGRHRLAVLRQPHRQARRVGTRPRTARKRMLRALGEFEITGLHTTIPAHVALLATDAFATVNHSTKWVEDEVDAATFTEAAAPEAVAADGAEEAEPLLERTIPVEVDGKRYSVKLWLPEAAAGTATPKKRVGATASGRRRRRAARPGAARSARRCRARS